MPDITMCSGKDCPFRDKCYRYTAEPDEYWQAYFSEPPIKDGKCDYYWGENAQYIWNQIKDITDESND